MARTRKKGRRRSQYLSNNKFRDRQCNALLNVLNQNKFTDVTFLIGTNQNEFKANRLLLASHSQVFEAMLYGQMQESKANAEIKINDIDPDAFQCVLNYCYCNDPKLTKFNIVAVRKIADKYQINDLSELCDETFMSLLNSSSICEIFNDAVNMKLDFYIKKCQNAIKEDIGESANVIVESEGFKKLSVNTMKIFLQSDNLDIKEEDLWEAVLKWKEYQVSHFQDKQKMANNIDGNKRKRRAANNDNMTPPKKKQKLLHHSNCKDVNEYKCKSQIGLNRNDDIQVGLKLLKEICPLIRFGLMNGRYFVKNVKPLKCLTNKELADILSYYQFKEEGCGQFSTKPRKTHHDTD